MTWSQAVKRYRVHHGDAEKPLSFEKLAQLLKVSTKTVTRTEKGKPPSPMLAEKYRAMGIQPEEAR